MKALLLVALAQLLSSCRAQVDTSYLPHNILHPDIVAVVNVTKKQKTPGGASWADSYSVGDRCYCASTFDHGIADYPVETPLGWMTVKQACLLLGPGPGKDGHPIYNDVQCGNGPPNAAGDEHTCPGRVDIGIGGCGQIGPEWNFKGISMLTAGPPPGEKREHGYWNTGRDGEDTSIITGRSWNYITKGDIKINGRGGRLDDYRSHRSGPNFSYLLDGFTPNAYHTIKLGFAEIYRPNCKVGKRVMNIKINGVIYRDDLDVFKEAQGCYTVYVETIENVKANSLGRFRIAIGATVENAMISTIDVRKQTMQSAPGISAASDRKVIIDAGAKNENMGIISQGTWRYGVTNSPTIQNTANPLYFRTHRSARNFSYNLKGFVPRKEYKLTLGFSEIWRPSCVNNSRVFSVKVNGKVITKDLDVFKKAGCATAYIEEHLVKADSNGVLTIEFQATRENSMVSMIMVDVDTTMGRAFVDAGKSGEDTKLIKGDTKRYGKSTSIAGTQAPELFQQHRFGKDFKYVLSGFIAGKKYKIQCGFAEIFDPSCKAGKRRFQIRVNDKVVENSLDVGAVAGCKRALVKNYDAVADSRGRIQVAFKALQNNAMISYIEVMAS